MSHLSLTQARRLRCPWGSKAWKSPTPTSKFWPPFGFPCRNTQQEGADPWANVLALDFQTPPVEENTYPGIIPLWHPKKGLPGGFQAAAGLTARLTSPQELLFLIWGFNASRDCPASGSHCTIWSFLTDKQGEQGVVFSETQKSHSSFRKFPFSRLNVW